MGSPANKKRNHWVINVIIVSFILTLVISYASTAITSGAGAITALAALFILMALGICADIVGIAVASADERPIVSMAAKRIPGAKQALWLVKHAASVTNILNDVVGDICGIVSGAACVALALRLLPIFPAAGEESLNILASALIAALTVGGKAAGKTLGIQYSREVILLAGRILSVFWRGKKHN